MGRIAVVLLTYDRIEYAVRTIHNLCDLISSEPIHFHLADDGSSEEYRRVLLEEAGEIFPTSTVTNAERGGYGKSYNLAMQVVHTLADIIIPLEDDWELQRTLYLSPLIQALDEGSFGCIRLGYLGSTQSLRGTISHVAGQTFLALDPDSEEPHVWSGHPRIETRDWQRAVGPWPEDLPDPGSTEFSVASLRASRQGVAWPMDLVKPSGDLFSHVGTIQARTDQIQEVEIA